MVLIIEFNTICTCHLTRYVQRHTKFEYCLQVSPYAVHPTFHARATLKCPSPHTTLCVGFEGMYSG